MGHEIQDKTRSRQNSRNAFDEHRGTPTSLSRRSSYDKLVESSSSPMGPEIQGETWSRRNSRNAFDEHRGTPASLSRRSSYDKLVKSSSSPMGPEIQATWSRWNSRNASDDEPRTVASLSRRNSSYDKLDGYRIRPENSEIVGAKMSRGNSTSGFVEHEIQGLGSRKSSYTDLDEFRRIEHPEIEEVRGSKRNSRTGFDELETRASRRNSYAQLDELESGQPESSEMQVIRPRRNSSNGFDEPETRASRRNSYAQLDESNITSP
jgi:hypothetical protein